MKTKPLKVYNQPVDASVSNEYPTSHEAFRQPCLQMIVGQRTAGKSYLAAKILAQTQKEKTFDVIYIITPSWNSNKGYFGRFIKPENVYEPTSSSVQDVINRVEADRDEWEKYLADKILYEQFQKDKNSELLLHIDPYKLMSYYDAGFMERKKPKWKYEKEEPPKSLLIMDDCLGSPAILQSSGLTRIATLNRHIAPLEKNHGERSACGLAVMILTQTYKMQQGIGRCLRENLSLLTLFKNRQEKQMESVREELANVVPEHLFTQAYEHATKEKFGNLTVDFKPKCPLLTFRKNLSTALTFPELPCDCQK